MTAMELNHFVEQACAVVSLIAVYGLSSVKESTPCISQRVPVTLTQLNVDMD